MALDREAWLRDLGGYADYNVTGTQPKQVWVANLVCRTVRNMDAKGPKWSLYQRIEQWLRGHGCSPLFRGTRPQSL